MKLKTDLGLVYALMVAGILYWITQDLEPEGRKVVAGVGLILVLWATNCVSVPSSPFYLFVFLYLTGIRDPHLLFSGFTSLVTWLVLALMILTISFKNTALEKSLLSLIAGTGSKSPRKLFYKLSAVNLAMTPLVANGLARTLFMLPMMSSVADLVGDKKYSKALFLLLAFVTTITAQLFLMSEAPLLTVEVLKQTTGIELSWGNWLKISWAPILGLVILLHLLLDLLYLHGKKLPQLQLKTDKIPFTREQKRLVFLMVVFLILWVTEAVHNIHPTILAFITVLSCLHPRWGFISWEAVKNEVDWGTFLIIGTALSLANLMKQYGVTTYIIEKFPAEMFYVSPVFQLIIVLLIASFVRLCFASTVGYLAVVLPVMITLAIKIGLNPVVVGMFVSYIGATAVVLPMCTAVSLLLVYHSKKLPPQTLAKFGLIFQFISILWYILVSVLYWPKIGLPIISQ